MSSSSQVDRTHGTPLFDGAEAFLFDCDGLLVGTEQLFTVAERHIFASYGLEFTPQHKARLLGNPVPEVGARIASMVGAPEHADDIAVRLMDEVFALTAAPLEPLPGVVELLDLIARKRPCAVVSNSPRDLVAQTLKSSGLDGRFAEVVVLEDAANPKPAPDLYLEAARRFGVEPARCVAFEDSPTGVRAARAAGIPVVGVPSHVGADIGATWHVASLGDAQLRASIAANRDLGLVIK